MSNTSENPPRDNSESAMSFDRCLNLSSYWIGYQTAQAVHRQVSGENRGPVRQGGRPLALYANTENRSGAAPHPNRTMQSTSQVSPSGDLGRWGSIRRHTFNARDSVTQPVPGFSHSDISYQRAHRHLSWNIEATLWPNDHTDIDFTSLTMGLPQFIYQGPGNAAPGDLDLLNSSKLRWFHLPMNNVSIILAPETNAN